MPELAGVGDQTPADNVHRENELRLKRVQDLPQSKHRNRMPIRLDIENQDNQRALGDLADDVNVTDAYKHPSQTIFVESCCGIGSLQTESRH